MKLANVILLLFLCTLPLGASEIPHAFGLSAHAGTSGDLSSAIDLRSRGMGVGVFHEMRYSLHRAIRLEGSWYPNWTTSTKDRSALLRENMTEIRLLAAVHFQPFSADGTAFRFSYGPNFQWVPADGLDRMSLQALIIGGLDWHISKNTLLLPEVQLGISLVRQQAALEENLREVYGYSDPGSLEFSVAFNLGVAWSRLFFSPERGSP